MTESLQDIERLVDEYAISCGLSLDFRGDNTALLSAITRVVQERDRAREALRVEAKPFALVVREEITKQEMLIQKMDFPINPEMRNPSGIMASIRRERLELLKRLLDFGPTALAPQPAPTEGEQG